MQSHTSSTTTICATLGVSSIGSLRLWFIEKHLWNSFRYTSSHRYFLTSRTFWDCTENVGDDCLLHFQSSHVQNVDSPCPISSAVLLQYCWAEDSNNSRTKIGRIAVWSEDSISPWRVEQVIAFLIFVRVGSECVPWNVTLTARIQFDILNLVLTISLTPPSANHTLAGTYLKCADSYFSNVALDGHMFTFSCAHEWFFTAVDWQFSEICSQNGHGYSPSKCLRCLSTNGYE